ncbi:hypothetical protein ACWFMI_11790 [Nocardiopsis terrae]
MPHPPLSEGPPPGLLRLARSIAMQHPGWSVRVNTDAIASRRWSADAQVPLTRQEITLGFQGSLHAGTSEQLLDVLSWETSYRNRRLV